MDIMDNEELELAWKYIAYTDRSVFLTGKAGTGKTTFLRKIQELSPKRKIVVAPTGVAAINAQGVTIHSQFQLPFTPYVPGTSIGEDISKHYRVSKEKKQILRTLDLLIIDEISMVRCDVLDAIDNVLRKYRHHDRPFGGVQLLMIGDLQQLAPVAVEQEWSILKDYYSTPYFFSSNALQMIDYVTIELKHIYRQTDLRFIDLLGKIRSGVMDADALAQLNMRCIPGYVPQEGEIYLTTHNLTAQRYNEAKLNEIREEVHTFEAKIVDNFPESSFPAERLLTLKVGAQVMFIKNDSVSGKHLYYNGKIGKVVSIIGQDIKVKCKEDEEPISVTREIWENTKYSLDPETKEIKEEVEGSFQQIPLRLAWAITVHKSQGLTFDRAMLDINSSFAHGQVYVALSRCRTLEGLTLSQPLSPHSIICDRNVNDFTSRELERSRLASSQLPQMEQMYFLQLISELFDFAELNEQMRYVHRILQEHLYKLHGDLIDRYANALSVFDRSVNGVAMTFRSQYTRLAAMSPDPREDRGIDERVRKGAQYFADELTNILKCLIKDSKILIANQAVAKQYKGALEALAETFRIKTSLLSLTCEHGFGISSYLNDKAFCMLGDVPVPKKKVKEEKESTYDITLRLLKEGKSVKEIAKIREMSIGTIEGHLAKLVANGTIEIDGYVNKYNKGKILFAFAQLGSHASLADIKNILPRNISYAEIKMVKAELERKG